MIRKLKESDNGNVTVGIYGNDNRDDFKEYNYSIKNFIDVCKRAGLKVDNLDVNIKGSESWEMDLSGNPRTIYRLVNYRLPGYHMDSLKDFIDYYEIDSWNALEEAYGYDYTTYGYTVSFTVRIPDISDRMSKSRGLQDLLNKHLNNIKDSVDYYDTDFEVINGTGYFYITISNSVDFYYALEYLEKYAIGFDYDSRKMSQEDVIEKYVTQKYGWREDFKIKDIEKVSTVHYQD